MESAEYRAIKLNTRELCVAVKDNLIDVSGALFAADLISQESWEEVGNANHTRESRAAMGCRLSQNYTGSRCLRQDAIFSSTVDI